MNEKLVYKKDQKLEEIEDKIADILSEAIYSYIIRKGLLKKAEKNKFDKQSSVHAL